MEMYAAWANLYEGMRGADESDRADFENEDEWPRVFDNWWGPRMLQRHVQD